MKHESIEQFVIEGPEVIKLLLAGRERVAYGWCQGTLRRADTYCSLGAISLGVAASIDVQEAVLTYMAEVVGVGGNPFDKVFSLATWNDIPSRTQAEVVAMFDKAIALARADHGR